uniref:Uncharacterized protein n=1 Tax=Steinernema glaseri TaxID=37863 RepID=A0A1I7ZTF9_9BILA
MNSPRPLLDISRRGNRMDNKQMTNHNGQCRIYSYLNSFAQETPYCAMSKIYSMQLKAPLVFSWIQSQ